MTSTKRTDIHALSHESLDPEQYECLTVYDFYPDFPRENEVANEIKREALESGAKFTGVHGGSYCDHCGAALRYAALMRHVPTNGLIWIGEQCLDGRFSVMKADFREMRERSAAERRKQKRLSAFQKLCEEHPTLAYATYAMNLAEDDSITGSRIGTMNSIAHKARQYGNISDKQLKLLDNLFDQMNDDIKRAETREQERDEALPVPGAGKHEFDGVIVKAEFRSNPYGPGGSEKITVKTDEGWLAWGTLPYRLEDEWVSVDTTYKGRRIHIHATLELSDRDDKFCFFKRPLKETRWLDV